MKERRDGFPGQRLRVLPRPVVTDALGRLDAPGLVVTDVGFFPRAERHYRRRRHGANGTIVICCVDGAGELLTPSGVWPVRPGDLAVIPAALPHEYWAGDDPWSIWWLHIEGPAVAALLAASRFTPERPVHRLHEPGRVVALIEEALEYLEIDDSAPNLLAASGAGWHLLAMLPVLTAARHGRADPVAQARHLITQRLPRRTSVAEAADAVSLSPSHLATLFKRETGYGILEYQTRQRLARAAELLTTSDASVASIGRRVGYDDDFYFSRQFRRVYGVPPRDYRHQATH